MRFGWRARLAAMLLALGITGADEARAQESPGRARRYGRLGGLRRRRHEASRRLRRGRARLHHAAASASARVRLHGRAGRRSRPLRPGLGVDRSGRRPRPHRRSRRTSCSAPATWAIAMRLAAGATGTDEGLVHRRRRGPRPRRRSRLRRRRRPDRLGAAPARHRTRGRDLAAALTVGRRRTACRRRSAGVSCPGNEGNGADLGPGAATVLSGWGRWPVVPGHELLSEDLAAVTAGANLTRGLGRSYGDASLPAAAGARVAGSRLADRVLALRSRQRRPARRGRPGLARRQPHVPAARLVRAGDPRHVLRHARRRGRLGRPRQEPPQRRHLRPARPAAAAARRHRRDRRGVAASIEPELFDATVGGMGSPATCSTSTSRCGACRRRGSTARRSTCPISRR